MFKKIILEALTVANEAAVARTTGFAGLVNGLFVDAATFRNTRIVADVTGLILAAVK